MKIRIIGASGSGKTCLAKMLSEKCAVPAYALDDLFWDNAAGGYNVKRDPQQRDRMLADILRREDWILEGVQHAWLGESFEKADVIYLLETPPILCRLRIIRRFFRRKWHRTTRKNETLRSVLNLLKWTKKFYRVNLAEIREELEPYRDKVVILKTKRDVRALLEGEKSRGKAFPSGEDGKAKP